MKLLVFIKICVFIMTGLLVAGFVFLITKITDKHTKSKENPPAVAINPAPAPILMVEAIKSDALDENETIISMQSCDDYVCLLTSFNKLLVINPGAGTLRHKINLGQ